ncbi:hypothetical protein RND71_004654 [Anisodus tanguticus]|uniref:E3 ubiquitin-protein ligase RMA n=1 Tax=Anisodus tanguticus TaxID=243964 RepID=A0AAE1SPZ8_9SOLA|nr:hypothetical protein RND71_004654 [Anisodus tanguticus]
MLITLSLLKNYVVDVGSLCLRVPTPTAAPKELCNPPVFSCRDISLKRRNSVPLPTTTSDNIASCFDCNICLDSAHDPVVTLCGHLYCWPCIYKWLQVDSSGPVEKSKCPVCKARISNSSVVPLYGRGLSSPDSKSKKSQADVDIPHRPQAIGTTTPRNPLSPTSHVHQRLLPTFQQHRQYFPQAFGSFAAMTPSSFGSTAMTSLFSPVVGVFGEMFSARMFGIAYPHPSSYLIRGSGGPRMRREEMQVISLLWASKLKAKVVRSSTVIGSKVCTLVAITNADHFACLGPTFVPCLMLLSTQSDAGTF